MPRRGFTLIEVLVAMILFVIVASLVMMVFSNQNRSFHTESDKAEVALMAKGTLDELTHAVRMTGSDLPEDEAGLKATGEGVTFVMNERGGLDTVLNYSYDQGRQMLGVRVNDASSFSHQGNALLLLTVSPSTVASYRVLPISKRFASRGGCGDSLELDASPLLPTATTTIDAIPLSPIYNLDSVRYWKRNDTLLVQRNRLPPAAFAVGVDTLKWTYWNSNVGWKESVADMGAERRIDKVGIRVVTRNQSPDPKLREIDSKSGGYRFSVLETEVALRNTGLVNQ